MTITSSEIHLVADPGEGVSRLDQFLKKHLAPHSRAQIQRWIRQGAFLLNKKNAQPADRVRPGDLVEGSIPDRESDLLPEDIPLKILHEDQSILVINKPAGMLTHPASGKTKGTLANAVAFHLASRSKVSGIPPGGIRPGIVHRLDKETSGVLIIAKTIPALDKLSGQFERRKVQKVYRTIVYGRVDSSRGEIEGSIGKQYRSFKMAVIPTGRFARTDFRVLRRMPKHTYLEVYPKTGRTHQIRVHLSKIGHPVAGDKTYSNVTGDFDRHMLHAYRITIRHPDKGRNMTFTAPIPTDFSDALKAIA